MALGLEDKLKTKCMYICQEGSGQVRLVCQPFKTECPPEPISELKFLPKHTGFGRFQSGSVRQSSEQVF